MADINDTHDIQKDRETVRELAKRVSEIAALPQMDENRRLWRALNALKPERPMVAIDQICWSQMNVDDELTLRCADPELRAYEESLRQTLYRWKHFPADMVIEPFIRVPKAVTGATLGMQVHEEVAITDPQNDVRGHRFENQFNTMEDIYKVKMPTVGHDAGETARRMALAHELFDGVIGVREEGWEPYLSLWDQIAMWMGVQNALFAMMDDPDMMHALVDRMVAAYMSMLDQMEAQGLLCYGQTTIHCTGAQTDELPAPGFDPAKPRTLDIWMYGLAQMFSTCSPAMFDEYEIQPNQPLFERFGLVYYGCCDPLDGKMAEVRKIRKARKISMSPWVNQERGAAEIGRDYVFSRKPSPAFLAWETFDEAAVRADLVATRDICKKEGCPVEFILKDISTVAYDPRRLWRWAEIAYEVVRG